MVSSEQDTAILDALGRIEKCVARRAPDFWNVPISDGLPAVVDYRGYRYLYVRAGQDLSLITTWGSTNTFHLPPEIWYRINYRPGTHLFTSGAGTTSIILAMCATDDLIEYQPPYSSSTTSPVAVNSSASNVQLLAANYARKGAYFFNNSTANLFLAYGTTAATTSLFTTEIQPSGFFEMPTQPIFTGPIQGIWSAANGQVNITELT